MGKSCEYLICAPPLTHFKSITCIWKANKIKLDNYISERSIWKRRRVSTFLQNAKVQYSEERKLNVRRADEKKCSENSFVNVLSSPDHK